MSDAEIELREDGLRAALLDITKPVAGELAARIDDHQVIGIEDAPYVVYADGREALRRNDGRQRRSAAADQNRLAAVIIVIAREYARLGPDRDARRCLRLLEPLPKLRQEPPDGAIADLSRLIPVELGRRSNCPDVGPATSDSPQVLLAALGHVVVDSQVRMSRLRRKRAFELNTVLVEDAALHLKEMRIGVSRHHAIHAHD